MTEISLLEQTDYITELNEYIDDFLARNSQKAGQISPHYETMWNEVRRLLGKGGKRLRPRLTILSFQAFGGRDVNAILPIAVAQELIHLAMLIQDDIIDRDYVRYGIDNVGGGYKNIYKEFVADETDLLHYAHSAAMLAGDSMLSSGFVLIGESKVDPALIIKVQKIFGDGVFNVIGGELIDTESVFRSIGDIPAEVIALYKTASYTFVAPMLVGATLAQAPAEHEASIRKFAESIGVAFQLQDDIIGVFGDEKQTGKSTTSDIREGKKTYMIEQFYKVASDEDKTLFDRYFGNQTISVDEVEVVKSLLVSSGAKKRTQEAIDSYEKSAREALAELPIHEPYLHEFEKLIAVSTKRAF